VKRYFGAFKKLDYAHNQVGTSFGKSQRNSRGIHGDRLMNSEQEGVIWISWKRF